jgi:hypothetical protein
MACSKPAKEEHIMSAILHLQVQDKTSYELAKDTMQLTITTKKRSSFQLEL